MTTTTDLPLSRPGSPPASVFHGGLLSSHGKAEATTNDGLFDNDQPNSPSEIIGFLKPHL